MVVVVVEVWMPSECHFIDGWYMWNRIKRADFGRAAVFTVVFGWVALFLSRPVFFFFSPFFLSLLQTLGLCALSFNPLFSSQSLSLSSCPRFFCERRQHWGFQFGSSCWGLVHGHQISFTQFCWQLTLKCQQLLFFSSATTVCNYSHHHLHYYYHHHHRYRHHL